MQPFRFILPLVLAVAACGPVALPGTASAAPAAAATNLTGAQKAAIGKKIWQNECGGTVAGLTTWNAGEEFPSLGIGHFIWYPEGFNGRFEESWPQFVAFARQQGANPPAVALQRHAPWKSKAEFRGPQVDQLRQWLASTVPLQTDFIIARSRAALPKVLAAAPASDRGRLQANYYKVASTANGTYALIDYVNFKGEGIQASERYNGKGWGLLQVLGSMKDVPAGQPAAAEFSASAKRMLTRRIENSPPARGEARWKEGWLNRCSTYARPL
ncbi:hypothetical protein [Luteolibacter soli]|uniref:Uncharacterized protein n=1 Tax=Luteolibacter soli TaxID=3135280 RepID=A0ABU9AZ23_9BACT